MASFSTVWSCPDDTNQWTHSGKKYRFCTAWCNRDGHEYQQLLLDEATFKEHLEEEAKAEKERAIYDKELEEFLKAEQAHDELFRMEFRVKSDSEYKKD
ncbi:hypothetical protein Tco_1058168 [Tanacetum coccineum]|uniref:Uncharacterized protein n=1 Tax=Tanacetum coccineum TaxID=301880 RepID=A0ABQ5H7F6_9ASTR